MPRERERASPHLRVIDVLHAGVFLHGGFLFDIQGDLLERCEAAGEQLCKRKKQKKRKTASHGCLKERFPRWVPRGRDPANHTAAGRPAVKLAAAP